MALKLDDFKENVRKVLKELSAKTGKPVEELVSIMDETYDKLIQRGVENEEALNSAFTLAKATRFKPMLSSASNTSQKDFEGIIIGLWDRKDWNDIAMKASEKAGNPGFYTFGKNAGEAIPKDDNGEIKPNVTVELIGLFKGSGDDDYSKGVLRINTKDGSDWLKDKNLSSLMYRDVKFKASESKNTEKDSDKKVVMYDLYLNTDIGINTESDYISEDSMKHLLKTYLSGNISKNFEVLSEVAAANSDFGNANKPFERIRFVKCQVSKLTKTNENVTNNVMTVCDENDISVSSKDFSAWVDKSQEFDFIEGANGVIMLVEPKIQNKDPGMSLNVKGWWAKDYFRLSDEVKNDLISIDDVDSKPTPKKEVKVEETPKVEETKTEDIKSDEELEEDVLNSF